MRPTYCVDPKDSLELAARKLRENGCGILPVTENGFLSGAITERSLARGLAEGLELTDAVECIASGALTAPPSTTGAEALRLLETSQSEAVVVVDDAGRVLGVLTPSDLYPKRIVPPRPALVGGMATPFGVYLTTGKVRAGAGHLALITTGMTLFGLFLVSAIFTSWVTDTIPKEHVPPVVITIIQEALPFILFLIGMRAIPLSGTHAAEHKVVHAIERGEDLVPSTVRRMPRVHPRCGTNLAVGATLFMGIGTSDLIPISQFRLLFAAIMTLVFWRPLGSAMQYYVTTKKPTDAQLLKGIQTGRELLEKHAARGSAGASVIERIINSGMLHVVAGSAAAIALAHLIGLLFHLPIDQYLF